MSSKSEEELQNEFQSQIEDGLASGRKIVRWNEGLARLKRRNSMPSEPVGHKQVLMGSDAATGIVGLVEGIAAANAAAFNHLIQAWEKISKGTVPTVADLAEAAAAKLAALWEAGSRDDEKTRGYRLLLAYGSAHAWEERNGVFGHDPRRLGPGDIPNWPRGLDPVSFRAVHSSEALPFLDLGIPTWVEPENRGQAVQAAHALTQGVAQNSYTWMREFVVHTLGGREERADFTLFVHGLPILWTEMKTSSRGLDRAADDFLKKETYRTAPLRLLCDGNQAVLTAMTEGSMEKWFVGAHPIGHGAGIPTQAEGEGGINGGQAYLVGQVLAQPERFEFLVRRASCFDLNGRFLVARPQQYQALANWWRDLLWSGCAGQAIDDRLIRHTQRTGKTHTMIRAIRLALAARGSYGAAFDLAVLMVGELPIIRQIAKAFLKENTGLLDTAVVVDEIKTRQAFRDAIQRQKNSPGTQRVMLANTQKLDGKAALDGKAMEQILKDTKNAGAGAPRALVVLDESHLAQTGDLANSRRLALPGAIHLLLTATPKDAMAAYYGISKLHQTLDNFGYRQALEAGLVVPVRFERAPCAVQVDPVRLENLARTLGATQEEINSATAQLDGTEEIGEDDSAVTGRKVEEILARLEADLIPERLEAVVKKWQEIKDAIGQTPQGSSMFLPRAMIFCRDRRQAKAIIKWIQALNEQKSGPLLADHEKNLYGGLRFGLDIADFGNGVDTIQKYNPGVSAHDAIKARFESDEADTRIDVLLAVGKYTKGYDNAHLCMVVLLKTVREPSLINQIYTRPATLCEGKASGLCFDLALGTGNVESWKESLKLYDQEQSDLPLFDEAGVKELLTEVEHHLTDAAASIKPSWVAADLGLFSQLGAALDLIQAGGQAITERFVAAAGKACETVRRLPDAAVLGPLRDPLLGVKVLLGSLRQLFPELDITDDSDVVGDGSGDNASINRIDPEAFGKRIDRALAILQTPSLKHFLNISTLSAEVVAGGSMGSNALGFARTHKEIQTAIEAAKALLGAHPGHKDPPKKDKEEKDKNDGVDSDVALRLALENALTRLIEHAPSDISGERDKKKMAAAERALVQVQEEIRRMQARPQSGLVELLSGHIRKELDRRWGLLGLPEAARGQLDPLVKVAGQQWGDAFLGWRGRMGAQAAHLDAVAAGRRWFESLTPQQTTLLWWISAAEIADEGGWRAATLEVFQSNPGQAAGFKAALGESEHAPQTAGQPSLLEIAARKAAQNLAQIEANAAWMEARNAS